MTETDVVLIGAGIMSATLGTLLRLVEQDWSITLIERLDGVAAESSDPWHNAGTGHSALCELNYTPELPDGSIDITRAVLVNEQFQVSRQFWSHAVENGVLADPRSFINPVPHVSFVQGAERVDYLRRRREALVSNPLFASTTFIDDPDEFARRLPLMAADRNPSVPVALNWTTDGTDVDFGSLSKQLIGYGVRTGNTTLFGHEGAQTIPRVRRQLDDRRAEPPHRRHSKDQDPLRVRRCGGRSAPDVEGKHRGGQRIRRVPGQRAVPAHPQPDADRGAPRQGVRLPALGRATDFGAAPRHADHRRQAVVAFWAVRRVVSQIPQTRRSR